jgi:hypothetical protein
MVELLRHRRRLGRQGDGRRSTVNEADFHDDFLGSTMRGAVYCHRGQLIDFLPCGFDTTSRVAAGLICVWPTMESVEGPSFCLCLDGRRLIVRYSEYGREKWLSSVSSVSSLSYFLIAPLSNSRRGRHREESPTALRGAV